jgi:hypothetical protein
MKKSIYPITRSSRRRRSVRDPKDELLLLRFWFLSWMEATQSTCPVGPNVATVWLGQPFGPWASRFLSPDVFSVPSVSRGADIYEYQFYIFQIAQNLWSSTSEQFIHLPSTEYIQVTLKCSP